MSSSAPTSSLSVGAVVGIGLGAAVAGVCLTILTIALINRLCKRWPWAFIMTPPKSMRDWEVRIYEDIVTGSQRRIAERLPLDISLGIISEQFKPFEWLVKHIADYCAPSVLRDFHKVPVDNEKLTSLTGFDCDWDGLLNDKRMRKYAVMMLISRFLASRIDAAGDPEMTLLPPDVLSAYQKIMADWETFWVRCKRPMNAWDLPHIWRGLTMRVLLKDTYPNGDVFVVHDESSDPDPRIHRMKATADQLREVLTPFVDPKHHVGLPSILKSGIKKVTKLGTDYFSSLIPIELYWPDAKDVPKGNLAVFPGIRYWEEGPREKHYKDYCKLQVVHTPLAFPRDLKKWDFRRFSEEGKRRLLEGLSHEEIGRIMEVEHRGWCGLENEYGQKAPSEKEAKESEEHNKAMKDARHEGGREESPGGAEVSVGPAQSGQAPAEDV